LTTYIFCAAPQVEEGTFARSYIPTPSDACRAANDFQEVDAPFPITSDTLGSGITTSHIEHPLSGAECAATFRLNIEATSALRD
jgi:hypothetical protein